MTHALTPMQDAGRGLVESVICPHCWHSFSPMDSLWVARHDDLYGDPVAGPSEKLRFLPSRFNADGVAIDPGGMDCREVACPRCHMVFSRALLEVKPLFASIIGATSSGKTYFLATMTWTLRTIMGRFGWSFEDADPAANEKLHDLEQTLFFTGDPDEPVGFQATFTAGDDLYRNVRINGQPSMLPRPFQFLARPESRGSQPEPADRSRVVVLYDNAGEHFTPEWSAHDTMPVTEHLRRSEVLLFIMDPTQDPRILDKCPWMKDVPGDPGAPPPQIRRQEVILTEAANRVREAARLSHTTKHDAPLIMLLAKSDVWDKLLETEIGPEPVATLPDGRHALDIDRVRRMSEACRGMLRQHTPEIVSVAEGFCKRVLYVPVSSLGRSPEWNAERKGFVIRPREIEPRWVSVPMLCAMQSVAPTLFPAVDVSPENRG